MKPIVSIVMPCLNGLPYLRQAIESVQSQTHREWELIIVDDGSTDGSPQAVAAAAREDARIVQLTTSGRTGAARTRNVGLSRATGRYVAFLDCDDWWHREKLARQLDWLQKEGAAFCCSPYVVCDKAGSPLRLQQVRQPLTIARYLKKQLVIGCLTVVVDKAALGEFRFKEDLPLVEDFLLWCDLLNRSEQKGLRVVSTPEPLAYYRVHPGGQSARKLRHAQAHWHVLKHELGLSAPVAAYCFASYVVNGLMDRARTGVAPEAAPSRSD